MAFIIQNGATIPIICADLEGYETEGSDNFYGYLPEKVIDLINNNPEIENLIDQSKFYNVFEFPACSPVQSLWRNMFAMFLYVLCSLI